MFHEKFQNSSLQLLQLFVIARINALFPSQTTVSFKNLSLEYISSYHPSSLFLFPMHVCLLEHMFTFVICLQTNHSPFSVITTHKHTHTPPTAWKKPLSDTGQRGNRGRVCKKGGKCFGSGGLNSATINKPWAQPGPRELASSAAGARRLLSFVFRRAPTEHSHTQFI